ncbi:hypothetical protein BBJ28_00002978 [Nothophytophthora sp. Chile5]|nr:hypothetical protein BBJ28_00002978 [Nothophytophthora sp. Chile5]
MKLFCMIVGAAGSAFSLDAKPRTYVCGLKEAIKEGYPDAFKDVNAAKLQLYLARQNTGAWLSSSSDDVKALERGDKTDVVVALMEEEIDPIETVRSAFVGAPSENVIHVLVAVTTIFCIVPGSSAFAIRVSDGALICDLKDVIKAEKPHAFKDVNAAKLQLYLARQNTGAWLSSSSDDVKALERGDKTDVVVALMEEEIDPIETVRSAFVGAPSENVIHVLVAVTTIFCIVPGSSAFAIRVSDGALICDLKDVIKAEKPHAFKDVNAAKLQLYLARQNTGAWLSSSSDDVKALERGDKTDVVVALIGEEIDTILIVKDVFDGAPCLETIHVLAKLNNGEAASLSKISWDVIKDAYRRREYVQEARSVSKETVLAIQSRLKRSVNVIGRPQSETECTCVLFNLFEEAIFSTDCGVKTRLQYKLDSTPETVNVEGFADFTFVNAKNYVCVMGAKKVENDTENEDEDEEESEQSEERDPEKELQNGFAQALVGMEIANTWKWKSGEKTVKGIVSNYCKWTFIKLEYPEGGSGDPIVSCDEDELVRSVCTPPSDADLTRIVGKILAVLMD